MRVCVLVPRGWGSSARGRPAVWLCPLQVWAGGQSQLDSPFLRWSWTLLGKIFPNRVCQSPSRLHRGCFGSPRRSFFTNHLFPSSSIISLPEIMGAWCKQLWVSQNACFCDKFHGGLFPPPPPSFLSHCFILRAPSKGPINE